MITEKSSTNPESFIEFGGGYGIDLVRSRQRGKSTTPGVRTPLILLLYSLYSFYTPPVLFLYSLYSFYTPSVLSVFLLYSSCTPCTPSILLLYSACTSLHTLEYWSRAFHPLDPVDSPICTISIN